VWAEDCSFYFYPQYASGDPATGQAGYNIAEADWGQRPSVIIRGNQPSQVQGISTVYLLHFDRIVTSGGGSQTGAQDRVSTTFMGLSSLGLSVFPDRYI
jgi:hypothetical protein